jgi:hypothetical protein
MVVAAFSADTHADRGRLIAFTMLVILIYYLLRRRLWYDHL